MKIKIGYGIDGHELINGCALVLGGVLIPFERGLKGHSDADALTHAVIDAVLGAAGLGDIGLFFPNTDSRFKDANSLELLKETRKLIISYEISNIDAIIIADAPPLSPFYNQMRANIANALNINIADVNVKSKTEEGINATRGMGIKAYAAAALYKI